MAGKRLTAPLQTRKIVANAFVVCSPHTLVMPVPGMENTFVAEVAILTPSPWKSQGAFVTTSIRSVAAPTSAPTWFVIVPYTSASVCVVSHVIFGMRECAARMRLPSGIDLGKIPTIVVI